MAQIRTCCSLSGKQTFPNCHWELGALREKQTGWTTMKFNFRLEQIWLHLETTHRTKTNLSCNAQSLSENFNTSLNVLPWVCIWQCMTSMLYFLLLLWHPNTPAPTRHMHTNAGQLRHLCGLRKAFVWILTLCAYWQGTAGMNLQTTSWAATGIKCVQF